MEQLSLFKDGNKMIKIDTKVISASRMTDMPKFYPNELIDEIQKRIDNGLDIHTVVLWSKHPDSLLKAPLYDYLVKIKNQGIQLFYQCTITGMGSIIIGKNKDESDFMIEPRVPSTDNAIKDLEKVIELLGDPLRIKLRIDSIIKLKNRYTADEFTNLYIVDKIIRRT